MACHKITHHLLEASRGKEAIFQNDLGEKRNLSNLVWGRPDDTPKSVYEGSEMDHDLRRNQGGFLEIDDETHSKVEPDTSISDSPRCQRRSLGMNDIVYVWEHRHGPEVEVAASGANSLVKTW